MTTPTDNDLDFIRGQVGDKGETFVISQPELIRMWTKAEANFDSDLTEDVTIVYALRRLKAHYAKAVTAEGQDQRVYNNQLFQHYSTMLDEYEARVGMGGSRLSVSTLTLNLNLTSDDIEDREWDY